ncbi:MAG: SPFH domain-containing protein [Micrococcales bacterium]|nr:SPFH domain-containing protein [Micrococcales bacterium]
MALPFIEIIESTTPDPNLLMWKHPHPDAEIKNGAQLVVRESQAVLFLTEGTVADVLGPGRYALSTQNIPVVSRLKGWRYGFESPFKADVYFFNTSQFVNNKWGTPAPVIIRDPELGSLRVRAFGNFDVRIGDPVTFFREYATAYPHLTIGELERSLRDHIAPAFGEVLVQQRVPLIDLAGSMSALSETVGPLIVPYMARLGVQLTSFVVTSVTLPDEVSAHLDKMTQMAMVTDMDRFAQFSAAQAVGTAGTGMQQAAVSGAMSALMAQQMQAAPAPAPAVGNDVVARLGTLKQTFGAGLMDEAEYKARREAILDGI